mgnify:CR=1 FL=1
MTPRSGTRLDDRYELLEPLASGGMAQVWKARDLVLDRLVAVKVLHPHLATDRGFLLRFRREAIAAARLSHRSIVGIYDTVSQNGVEAIVMELISGETLRSLLDRNGTVSLPDAAEIGMQIADALDEAHRGGIVHRDIKPSNIMLCPDRRVMVTDFGIAKAGEDTDLTITGTLLGTAKYLAPEQVRGDDVDPRTDLYALGVVLYEALAGQAPFLADTDASTALARLHEDAAPLASRRPDAAGPFAVIVDRLLAREPSDRFDSARDLRAALSALVFPARPPGENDPSSPSTDTTTVVAPSVNERTSVALGTNLPRGLEIAATDTGSSGHDTDPLGSELDHPDDGGFVRSERSWMIPAFVVLVLGSALLIAALLISRSPIAGRDDAATTTSDRETTDTTPLANFDVRDEKEIVGVRSFDPTPGDGSENEDLTAAAFDDDLTTTWRTETYRQPNFGNLKPGVGLLIELGASAQLTTLSLTTPSTDWTIEIYVGNDFSGAADTWGPPVTSAVFDGRAELALDLGGAEGTTVLLWVTDHGTSEDRDDNPGRDYRFEVAEVDVS